MADMNIVSIMSKILLVLPILSLSCSFGNESNNLVNSCVEYANFSQVFTDETSDAFNGPSRREINQNFVEFCENSKVANIDECGKFEDTGLCENTVGVQADKIERCNGDSKCEVAFASTHVEDCDGYGRASLTNPCLFTRSYIENDIKYCDQIKEINIDGCDFNYGEESFIACYFNRGKCLWGVADRTADVSVCDTILASTEADLCNFSMAVKLHDSTLCEKLNSGYFSKDFCVEIVNSNGDHPAFSEGILNYPKP